MCDNQDRRIEMLLAAGTGTLIDLLVIIVVIAIIIAVVKALIL